MPPTIQNGENSADKRPQKPIDKRYKLGIHFLTKLFFDRNNFLPNFLDQN